MSSVIAMAKTPSLNASNRPLPRYRTGCGVSSTGCICPPPTSDVHTVAWHGDVRPTRVAGDWDWLADRYGLRGRVQQGVQRLTYGLTDLLTEASPPVALRDAVATAHRPVLLIPAGNVSDEENAARHIQRGAPGTVD